MGCQERKNTSENNSEHQIADSVSPEEDLIDFEISKLSNRIYNEAQLDDRWDDLVDVEESVLDLIGLDSKTVDTYLVAIDEDLEVMEEGDFPENFETQAIRSRLALVRVFVQKSIFYTRTDDHDSLNVALGQFFNAYNALITRIESTHTEISRTTRDSLLFQELHIENLDGVNPTLVLDTVQ